MDQRAGAKRKLVDHCRRSVISDDSSFPLSTRRSSSSVARREAASSKPKDRNMLDTPAYRSTADTRDGCGCCFMLYSKADHPRCDVQIDNMMVSIRSRWMPAARACPSNRRHRRRHFYSAMDDTAVSDMSLPGQGSGSLGRTDDKWLVMGKLPERRCMVAGSACCWWVITAKKQWTIERRISCR